MPPRGKPLPVDDFDESAMFGGAATGGRMPSGAPDLPSYPSEPPRTPSPPSNPLAKYYRQPGLHVKLPTNGAFLPRGSVRFTPAGDLPVWPMRAADEMLLKSPDALMSGYAIEKLLESCVPDIATPRLVSQPDLDVLLLSIRAATYGSKMPVNATCPSCGTENHFECHLPGMLDTVKPVPSENPVRLTDDIIAYVRPYDMGHASAMAMATFEETRKMQALDALGDKVSPEDRSKAMSAAMDHITKVRFQIMASCVLAIVVPEGEVNDRGAISDFLNNVSGAWVKRVEDKQDEINGLGLDKHIPCRCEKCAHEWTTELEFNPSTFFG